MKRFHLFLLILMMAGNLQAQINWLDDFEKAKMIAQHTQKLIVIDFWAVWCGPCQELDRQLWENRAAEELAENFIALKINIDNDKRTAFRYAIKYIPTVILTTATGEVIWQLEGLESNSIYLPILRGIPVNAAILNNASLALESNRKDPDLNFHCGMAYQTLGKEMKGGNLKQTFLNFSDSFLLMAKRNSEDEIFRDKMELCVILNEVYVGRPEKALKKLKKWGTNHGKNNLPEYWHFVMAKCYFSLRDHENFMVEKNQIKSTQLLDQLD